MTARLFTVHIVTLTAHDPFTGDDVTIYETDFAGLHFSRTHTSDLMQWVRVAARNRYGKQTQVIFLHERNSDQ